MSPRKIFVAVCGLGGALLLFAPSHSAHAATLAFADSETLFTICSGPVAAGQCIDYQLNRNPGIKGPALVPLTNDRHATSLAFQTTIPGQRIFITFNAQCDVNNPYVGYPSSFVISIAVDGFVLRPQSGNSGFCDDPTGLGQELMATRSVTYGVPLAGTHYVTITAAITPPVGYGYNVGSLLDSITRVED